MSLFENIMGEMMVVRVKRKLVGCRLLGRALHAGNKASVQVLSGQRVSGVLKMSKEARMAVGQGPGRMAGSVIRGAIVGSGA